MSFLRIFRLKLNLVKSINAYKIRKVFLIALETLNTVSNLKLVYSVRKINYICAWINIYSWSWENVLYNIHKSCLHVCKKSQLKLLRLYWKITSNLTTIFFVLFLEIYLGFWNDLILKSLTFYFEKMDINVDLIWRVFSVIDFQLGCQFLVSIYFSLFINKAKSEDYAYKC